MSIHMFLGARNSKMQSELMKYKQKKKVRVKNRIASSYSFKKYSGMMWLTCDFLPFIR